MSRQGLFNRLAARVVLDGMSILDLYAGSGSLGIEALSRGAKHATFVDSSRLAVSIISANLQTVDEAEAATVVKSDVFKYLQSTLDRPDIILADPPYDFDGLDRLIELSQRILAPGGYLVIEHDARHSFDESPNFAASGSYGRTKLTFFESEID